MAKPRIFISSTFYDLRQVRADLNMFIDSLGYDSVRNEEGNIPYHYGVEKFGITQADHYFESFFEYFDIIAKRPFSFESVDYIKKGYRRCVCGGDSIYYRINQNIV